MRLKRRLVARSSRCRPPMPRARPEHPTPGIARCPWPCSTTALVAANPSAANTGQGNLPRANKWENSNNVFLVANSASAAAQKSLPPPQPIAGRAIYVADPATMRPRQLWCALVGCPENVARGGVTPEGQELPEWLTWSEVGVGGCLLLTPVRHHHRRQASQHWRNSKPPIDM